MIVNFFSGIGGWELGLELAQELAQSDTKLLVTQNIEICPNAVKIFSNNFYDTPELNINDIHFIPNIQCSFISFPCAGTSNLGKRDGLNNIYSNLWYKAFSLCNKSKLIFIEQPSGFLHNGFSEVISNLNSYGYKSTSILLTARMFGLPHKRERIFIVASNTHDPHLTYWDKASKGWNNSFRATVQRFVHYSQRHEIETVKCSVYNGVPRKRVYTRFRIDQIQGQEKGDSSRWKIINCLSKSIVPWNTACVLFPYL